MYKTIDVIITNNFINKTDRPIFNIKTRNSISLLVSNNISPRVGERIESNKEPRVAVIEKITYNITHKEITTIYHVKII